MQVDRTGAAIRRVVLEGIVRDKDQFVSHLGVGEALPARVAGVFVGNGDRPTSLAEFISDRRIDGGDNELRRDHRFIVDWPLHSR